MIENNGKMSQAQEVRAQAFFMATQTAPRDRHSGDVDPNHVMETAEKFEAWLWEAQDKKRLGELVRLARQAAIALAETGSKEHDRIGQQLAMALAPFES